MELDFFGLFIEKLPSTLLLQRNEVRQAEVARIRAEIAKHAGKITRLGRLFAEIETDTQDLVKDVKEARDAIAALQVKEGEMLTEANVDVGTDAAWTGVVQLLRQHSPAQTTDAALDILREVSARLRVQLADNELRKRLIGPLKMLVSAIEIDVKGMAKKYRVKLLGGGYTEWRDVSKLNAELIEANLKNGHSKSSAKQSAMALAQTVKKPMTAEHRAKIARGNQGKKRSAEMRLGHHNPQGAVGGAPRYGCSRLRIIFSSRPPGNPPGVFVFMAKQKSMNIDQAQAEDEAFIIHLLRTKCRRTSNSNPARSCG